MLNLEGSGQHLITKALTCSETESYEVKQVQGDALKKN